MEVVKELCINNLKFTAPEGLFEKIINSQDKVISL